MSFQDTLRKSLTPELFTQVIDQLGDDFDFDLVPRSRLNKVIKQRNELREQLAENPQARGAGTGGDDEGNNGDGSEGGIDIDKLQKQWKAQSDQAVQEVKIQYAALDKLRAAEVIDPELVWSSNVLNKKTLKLDDAGALTGLDEQIENLKKNKTHLFKQAKQDPDAGTGKEGGEEGGTKVTTKEEFLKLDIDKQIAFKKANPEVFKTFMA